MEDTDYAQLVRRMLTRPELEEILLQYVSGDLSDYRLGDLITILSLKVEGK